MDTGSAIACEPRVVAAEQVIFTSVRGATAEGYRIIAAGGLRPDEKQDITRRSPSHGGLIDADPSALGLLSYPLKSGRHCVGVVRHAGEEHTARGGQRVHTHLAVLEADAFRAFDCDPVEAAAALLEVIGDAPEIRPAARLELLELSLDTRDSSRLTSGSGGGSGLPKPNELAAGIWGDRRMIAHIVSKLLGGAKLVLHGPPARPDAIQALLLPLPRAAREKIAVSSGVKFAPAREIDLALIHGDALNVQRLLRGRDIEFVNCAHGAPLEPSGLEGWIGLMQRGREQSRRAELRRLLADLPASCGADCFDRIVSLYRVLDSIPSVDRALDQLQESLNAFECDSDAERDLRERVRVAVQQRMEFIAASASVDDQPESQSVAHTGRLSAGGRTMRPPRTR